MRLSNTDRRSTERRNGGDRRRGVESRYAVIEIDADSIRLAVLVRKSGDEKPLLLTHELLWRKESASALTAAGCRELSDAIKTLVASERLAGSEAMLLLTPPLSVTRTATSASAQIEKQVKELEERGQFYLALGGGPFSMASRRYQLDARHEHALLTVANQSILETAAEACHQAGLQLRRVESSTVALSRAHSMLKPDDDSPALVVCMGNQSVELSVTHRGRLLLEYLPGGDVTPAEVPAIIEKHLQRIQRFCARKHFGQEDSIRKVYLTGAAAATQEALAAFGRGSTLEVAELDLEHTAKNWEPRGLGLTPNFAACVGGVALKHAAEHAAEGPNLLEKWIRESRKHQRPILVRSAAPLAATVLATLGMIGMNLSLVVSNGRLEDLVAQGEPVKGRYSALRLELLSTESKLRSFDQLSGSIPHNDLHQMVQRVGQCMPSDVWLERITVSDSRDSSLQGAGYTESGVYEFVRNLEAAPGASNVALQETGVQQRPEGPVTRFSLTAQVEPLEHPETDSDTGNERAN